MQAQNSCRKTIIEVFFCAGFLILPALFPHTIYGGESMQENKRASENSEKKEHVTYTPSSVQDDVDRGHREQQAPFQFPCSYAWELCDRRGMQGIPFERAPGEEQKVILRNGAGE